MNDRIALYSSALYSSAVEENVGKEVYDSLKVVKKVLEENDEYIGIVSSANLKADEREALIEEAFSNQVHVFCLNFMKMLAKKRLFNILIGCIEEYEKKYLKDNNITNAVITTAFELTEEKKASVCKKIESATGKTVIPQFKVDAGIVGGIIVQTDTAGVNASVIGKLESIQRHISKN